MTSKIILASKSSARQSLLENAGIPFTAISSDVDEDIIKVEARRTNISLEETALKLARAKASKVSIEHPESYVIGADQILGFKDKAFDKPKDLDEAKTRLLEFSGMTHQLFTAACVTCAGKVVWEICTIPSLTLEKLSEHQIDAYLKDAGEGVLASVGAYQLESCGARLFREIQGDYFSILGLPLLELVNFLRVEKLVTY